MRWECVLWAAVLFLTNMGADHLGDDQPDDPMFSVVRGALQSGKSWISGGRIVITRGERPRRIRVSFGRGRERIAKLRRRRLRISGRIVRRWGWNILEWTPTAPALKGQFLVALHGASKKKLDRGYRVVRVDKHGQVQDFITGFIDHGAVTGKTLRYF